VHYDQWLGPAPARPFNENRFHYHWHFFWEYGTSDLGNTGVHSLDATRWLIGKQAWFDALPSQHAPTRTVHHHARSTRAGTRTRAHPCSPVP